MKKIKTIFTDYWVGTICGAILLATSIQSIVTTLSSQLTIWTDSNGESGYGMGSYFYWQLGGSIVALLLGLCFLMLRKPKK